MRVSWVCLGWAVVDGGGLVDSSSESDLSMTRLLGEGGLVSSGSVG